MGEKRASVSTSTTKYVLRLTTGLMAGRYMRHRAPYWWDTTSWDEATMMDKGEAKSAAREVRLGFGPTELCKVTITATKTLEE